ncbi:MAG: nuclear transport factor 2 family protein [Gemmatimonadota bacterium]|nr:nuclear transport factor 2 family protein [Gemmatimonadota bacterium]
MRTLTLLGLVMGLLVMAAAVVHEEPLAGPATNLSSVDEDGQNEEAAVVSAVERLFEAMRTSDGELAASVFHADARLGRAGDQGIRFSEMAGFVERIGQPKEEVWDEPIWDWDVQVDGRLAQMWTRYAFYLDGVFSHCGIDAIQLYRSDEGGWQITQLVDTSRQEDCWLPPGRGD